MILDTEISEFIMAKKVRGSMWGLLKTFYLRRVRYTRKLLAYRRRKTRHSNGVGLPRNESEPVSKSQEVNLQREIMSMKTLIERKMINQPKSRFGGLRKKNKSKPSCEFCSHDVNTDPNPSQHCSDHKELGDVLQKILNSKNTDPFLEIIRDPTSMLVPYVRTLRYFPKFEDKMSRENPELKLLARSQSFMGHIKIRLKQAISSSKGHLCIKETNANPKAAVEYESGDTSEMRVSKIYLEGKKYLSEILKDGDLDGSVASTQFRQTLERILTFSDSNCSVPSPECTSLPHEAKIQTVEGREQNVDKDSSFIENLDEGIFTLSNSEVGEVSFAIEDATNSEDHSDTIEDSAKILSNVIESVEDSPAFLSPPASPHAQKVEYFDAGIDSTEQPSPVSVLDPFFADDDDISPERTRLRSSNHPIQLLQIEFNDENMSETTRDMFLEHCKEDEEHINKYVETVLQASELDQYILDPSLLDEVDFPCNRACYGKKLLFDCINEVLLEMYGVLRLNPSAVSVPDRGTIVLRMAKRVYWHVVPPPLPRTLQQVVEKDLSDAAVWMDLGLEMEGVGAEIGEVIIEELIAETILE